MHRLCHARVRSAVNPIAGGARSCIANVSFRRSPCGNVGSSQVATMSFSGQRNEAQPSCTHALPLLAVDWPKAVPFSAVDWRPGAALYSLPIPIMRSQNDRF